MRSVARYNASDVLQGKTTYNYDAFDRRISEGVDDDGDGFVNRTVWWVYDSLGKQDSNGHPIDDVVLILDGAGDVIRRFVHGTAADQILAEEDATTGLVTWPLADRLGTIHDRVIYDFVADRAKWDAHYSYDSFGRVVAEIDGQTGAALSGWDLRSYFFALGPTYGFQGREYEADVDLYYFRARWYDQWTGRFVSEDPIFDDTTNTYRFVGNGPTNGRDPSGLAGEGHHWVPINVGQLLYGEGIITSMEVKYFAGRRSGPLSDPHNYSTCYDGVNHRAYDEEVTKQIRNWKKAKTGQYYSIESVVDNIRDGKSWDGKPNGDLSKFNGGIERSIINPGTPENPNRFDIDTKENIEKKGESSLRRRGKTFAAFVTVNAIGGLLSGISKAEDAKKVAGILRNSKAMDEARIAAQNGDTSRAKLCLIGEGHTFAGEGSVYEQVREIDPIFGPIFRAAVEKGWKKIDEEAERRNDLLESLGPELGVEQ